MLFATLPLHFSTPFSVNELNRRKIEFLRFWKMSQSAKWWLKSYICFLYQANTTDRTNKSRPIAHFHGRAMGVSSLFHKKTLIHGHIHGVSGHTNVNRKHFLLNVSNTRPFWKCNRLSGCISSTIISYTHITCWRYLEHEIWIQVMH